MRIACLAWGSLLWKQAPLVIASEWRADGPRLPLEFARIADGGELSIVLLGGAAPMPTWWALLAATELDQAREQLRERERISHSHPDWVGSLAQRDTADAMHRAGGAHACPAATRIAAWLMGRSREIDAVVWTALPPRPADPQLEGQVPDEAEIIAYLQALQGDTLAHARDYIERVPAAIHTPYRYAIEARLGWQTRKE